jgi:biotin carboxylase
VLVAPEHPPRADGTVVAHLPWPTAGGWEELAAALPEPGRIAGVAGLTEGAVVPAARLRAALGLPGLDVAAAIRCSDKLAMKRSVRAAGLPCADFLACGPESDPREVVAQLGLPLVVKPRASSGGRGVALVTREEELASGFAPESLAERFVHGREMSCEAILSDGRVVFSNPTEYLEPRHANLLPASLPRPLADALRQLLLESVRALGVREGMIHLEVYRTGSGILFGELAVRPPGGHITRLIELAYGFDPWEAWLATQLGDEPRVRAELLRCAAAYVIHPGPGRIADVRGLEAARALPGVERVALRVGVGEEVRPRLGAGEEIGHILVVGPDPDTTARRLRAARDALEIAVVSAGVGF